MDIGASMSTARNVGGSGSDATTGCRQVCSAAHNSNLEQLMNLNKGVEQLSIGQLSNNTQEAIRFVGRDVVAKGNTLHLQDLETSATVHDSFGRMCPTPNASG